MNAEILARNSTLTSLAMLKVNLDVNNQDYLDYLVPFTIESLRGIDEPIKSDVVCSSIEVQFGLRIPSSVVELVLKRFARQDLLARRHGSFYLSGILPDTQIGKRCSDAKRNINFVLQSLRAFAKDRDEIWSEEETASVVMLFLGKFSVECLKAYTHGTTLPDPPAHSSEHEYIVASFIHEAYENQPQLFNSFIVLVKGHMLANALLCNDLDALAKKFSGVTFYLDSPLIFKLLGLEGEYAQKSVEELIGLTVKLRGTIAIFEHTAYEVQCVIKACANLIDNPDKTGRILDDARRVGRSKSDLLMIADNLEKHFELLGIHYLKTPRHNREFQIDESLLQGVLDEDVKYLNPRALEYDISSIRSVYTLRGNTRPTRLEDAKAVLVTSNTALAAAAYHFGQKHVSLRDVSAAITDFSLANIAWLKAPMGAPKLPEREVMAACLAALAPADHLWKCYIEEIDKLKSQGEITARDHELLRLSPSSRDQLMFVTKGRDDALSGGTVSEILHRVELALIQDKEAEIEKKDNRIQEVESERDGWQDRHQDVMSRIHWASDGFGRVISFILVGTAVCLAIASILAAAIVDIFDWKSTWPLWARLLIGLLVGTGGLYGITCVFFSFRPTMAFRAIESRASRLCFKLSNRIILGTTTDSDEKEN